MIATTNEDLTSNDIYKDLCAKLKEFAKSKNNPFVEQWVDIYAKAVRPFCTPTFSKQDTSDVTQRRGTLVGGFPYTSASFPWPKVPGSELFMQPIVQLNLATVSQLLKIDLGTGLLQVWGPVVPRSQSWIGIDFLTRLIPPESATGTPDEVLYDWKVLKNGKPIVAFGLELDETHPADAAPCVTWSAPLPMVGSRWHISQAAHNLMRTIKEDFDWDEIINYCEEIEEAALWDSPLWPGDLVYLGGFGGQDGGENSDPSSSDDLLVRISDNSGYHFCLHWAKQRDGSLRFLPDFTIRAV